MAELSIKHFPEELMHELKTTALAHKMTLRDYVIRELSELMAVAPAPQHQTSNPQHKH